MSVAMPKKKKGKQENNWEDDADAIAQEHTETKSGAEESGSSLATLFDHLIGHKKATEANYDRATDELASGAKTEDQLISEWKSLSLEPSADDESFERQWGYGGNDVPAVRCLYPFAAVAIATPLYSHHSNPLTPVGAGRTCRRRRRRGGGERRRGAGGRGASVVRRL